MKLRLLALILIVIILVLQTDLWLGRGGLVRLWQLNQAVDTQSLENADLLKRNQRLQAEVMDLKGGVDAVEELARSQLGMIKKNEVFIQVVPEQEEDSDAE